MNISVCPECGAGIRYWNEFFFYENQNIDPITGKYGRATKTKPQEHNCGDMQGFECTKCSWSINITYECPDNLINLLDREKMCKTE